MFDAAFSFLFVSFFSPSSAPFLLAPSRSRLFLSPRLLVSVVYE